VGAGSATSTQPDGLVLGFYEGGDLTDAAKSLDIELGGRLSHAVRTSNAKGKPCEVRLLYGLSERWPRLALVGLGSRGADEERRRESARKAVGGDTSRRATVCVWRACSSNRGSS
jgi:hypothetical protein